jgi:hypothetical protein
MDEQQTPFDCILLPFAVGATSCRSGSAGISDFLHFYKESDSRLNTFCCMLQMKPLFFWQTKIYHKVPTKLSESFANLLAKIK